MQIDMICCNLAGIWGFILNTLEEQKKAWFVRGLSL